MIMRTSEKAKLIVVTSHWRLVYNVYIHHEIPVQIKLFQYMGAQTSVFLFCSLNLTFRELLAAIPDGHQTKQYAAHNQHDGSGAQKHPRPNH